MNIEKIKPYIVSGKTTILGFIAIVIAVATGASDFLNSEDLNAFIDSIIAGVTGLGLILARDANKSSQDSNIRPETINK